jgi:hypothetical protein
LRFDRSGRLRWNRTRERLGGSIELAPGPKPRPSGLAHPAWVPVTAADEVQVIG